MNSSDLDEGSLTAGELTLNWRHRRQIADCIAGAFALAFAALPLEGAMTSRRIAPARPSKSAWLRAPIVEILWCIMDHARCNSLALYRRMRAPIFTPCVLEGMNFDVIEKTSRATA
ncbi:hypothetical protein A6X20_17035 [Bradyrhizobium elkanii]|nr:hypothetical protein A6452_38730 [Bradyrhizobium elkanii]ODM82819.1 hypothetical protein A6X20_17035 [Bradyrhizobium elkanii]